MAARRDHKRWTATEQLAPGVICKQPAILRSPRGKPCHWTVAVAALFANAVQCLLFAVAEHSANSSTAGIINASWCWASTSHSWSLPG